MAKVRQPVNTAVFGKTPTVQQKLGQVATKFGVPGVEQQQGSAVNIFDTLLLTTATGRTTLEFFKSTSNKSKNFSNWQNQQLNQGETLIISRIQFYLITMSGTDLTSDANAIIDITPIPVVLTTQVSRPGAFKQALMGLKISNVTIIKDYMTCELQPEFNAQNTGIAVFDNTTVSGTTHEFHSTGYSGIQLDSPSVLLMNNKFSVTLELPPVGTVTGNMAIVCNVGRFGSIYSPKGTF